MTPVDGGDTVKLDNADGDGSVAGGDGDDGILGSPGGNIGAGNATGIDNDIAELV